MAKTTPHSSPYSLPSFFIHPAPTSHCPHPCPSSMYFASLASCLSIHLQTHDVSLAFWSNKAERTVRLFHFPNWTYELLWLLWPPWFCLQRDQHWSQLSTALWRWEWWEAWILVNVTTVHFKACSSWTHPSSQERCSLGLLMQLKDCALLDTVISSFCNNCPECYLYEK